MANFTYFIPVLLGHLQKVKKKIFPCLHSFSLLLDKKYSWGKK